MANSKAYDKIERMVMERVSMLEEENARLRQELGYSKAKLEVYERIASISDAKNTIGFGPPIYKDE